MANTARTKELSSPFRQDEWARVGETLRTIRELRGMSVADLAQVIGISRPYLHNLESGHRKLTNVLLAKVADALGVTQISIMRPELAASETDAESAEELDAQPGGLS